ncbi:hypothetical protein [Kineosporia sp. A_224]|uniref:hypothetical protein n=1 Tax=Kineosporia sp. A_224 TaxID=1962180 RepID=UPI000B4BBCA8|nr:hypothetical protein [Kineosporia sp. A_224]
MTVNDETQKQDEFAAALRALRHGDGWEGDVYDVYTVMRSPLLRADQSPDMPRVIASALARVYEEGRMRSMERMIPPMVHMTLIIKALGRAQELSGRPAAIAEAQAAFSNLVLG